MRRVSVILCLFFVFPLLKCVENYTEKNKQLSHFDRYKVEELSDELNTEKSKVEDPNSNLVAFLVQNAKEIFGETEESTFVFKLSPRRTQVTPVYFPNPNKTTNFIKFINSINLNTYASYTSTSTTMSDDNLLVLNITRPFDMSSMPIDDITTTIFNEPPTEVPSVLSTQSSTDLTTELFTDIFTESTIDLKSVRDTLFNLTSIPSMNKPIRTLTKPSRTEDRKGKRKMGSEIDSTSYNEITTIAAKISSQHTRSCIFCNNVESKQCNNPEPNLAPSIQCSHEDDLCYSQQTPFGIIDRGCFNINRNITTFVCACNLCNYISISEMPYVFTKKKEWIDNVIDLTRTKGFRTSIFKDMLCLSCEVNTTETTFNMAYTANCLEGNIGVLKTQKCTDDEICGVKTLKSEGYVWRGCLKNPLYNYWWSLCDSDLCNNEPLFTLYDSP